MWLLHGLPAEWKHFKSIARHNTVASAGLHAMLRFLQVEEAALKTAKPPLLLPPAPTFSPPSFKPAFRASTAISSEVAFSPYSCHRCGSHDHFVAQCPHPDLRSAITDQRLAAQGTCEHCGRPGHTKDKCFHLHGFPSTSRSSQRGRDRSRSPDDPHFNFQAHPLPMLHSMLAHLPPDPPEIIDGLLPSPVLTLSQSVLSGVYWILVVMSIAART